MGAMTDEALIEELARAMCDEEQWYGAYDRLYESEQDTYRRNARAILPIIKRETSRASDFQTAVAYDCGIRAGEEDERRAIVAWLRLQWRGGTAGIEVFDLADTIEAGEHRK